MKKILTVSYACILLSIVLCSCSSNFSITKRKYTKGYYVAHTTKPITVSSYFKPDSRLLNLHLKIASHSESDLSNQLLVEKTAIEPIQPLNRINMVVSKTQLKNNNNNRREISGDNEDRETAVNNGASPGGERGESAALSLLWIVIVVILILWLIGLLAGGFGLGGLINLLLVVALVLLILWLLRVI